MMDTSAETPTVAELVALLLAGFGSVTGDETVAVFVIVEPFATVAPTLSTIVKEAEAPFASVASVQLTDPVPPTAGFAQVNAGPVACVSDTKVVPAGSASVSVTLCASFGPLFMTVTV